MSADGSRLVRGELTECVRSAYYGVYNELGAGFLESVYENALALALRDIGLSVVQQAVVAVHFRGVVVGDFRVDLLVDEVLIIEVKACASLMPVHEAQLLNYPKATGLPVGLLLNFGPKPQFKRRVHSDRLIRIDRRQSVANQDV